KQNIGQFISTNSFFSTTDDRSTALFLLGDITTQINSERVLFEIDADPKIVNTKPFADISKHSHFPDESEVLFMTGSIFRLDNIYRNDDEIWIIRMTLCNDDEHDLKQVLMYMKQQIENEETNLQTLAKLLWEMGEFDLAEKYLTRLLKQLPSNDPLHISLYEDLGKLASQGRKLDMSMEWRQKLFTFKKENPLAINSSVNKTNNSIKQSNDTACAPLDRIDVKSDFILVSAQTIINQIKYVMTQMYELHEFTTPRYFFILPAKHSDWAILNTVQEWYHLHYKLYFLCECSNEPHKMHVAPHNGYSIKKTREFIVKYGPYLQITLQIAQILFKLGSFVIPKLDSVLKAVGSDVDTILTTPDMQKEMEEQLNLVEKLLDRVDHQWAQSKSTTLEQDRPRGVPLQGPDLREVETYLDVVDNKRKSIPVNPTDINTYWKQHGITIAGGNGEGNQLNQLSHPQGIYVDDGHKTIYIADGGNHRIVEWKYNANSGHIVAGGNGKGNRSDQLSYPRDVIVDKKNGSIIICDYGNSRVVRWSRQNGRNGETIISDIDCHGLTMDNNGDLYVSDTKKNEVRRWKQGEREGTIVAGGNGKGNHLNQLNCPTYIFVDEDQSIYVSDTNNHRVMKWMKGAKEGIVIGGKKSKGHSSNQLSNPQRAIADHFGNVYVADCDNHQIIRRCKGSKEGSTVVGGNEKGEQPNQLNYPTGLSFDAQGNLYIVDWGNHRIQKFDLDLN
ncbi:unnamed protein product, partial [Adineta steineri]